MLNTTKNYLWFSSWKFQYSLMQYGCLAASVTLPLDRMKNIIFHAPDIDVLEELICWKSTSRTVMHLVPNVPVVTRRLSKIHNKTYHLNRIWKERIYEIRMCHIFIAENQLGFVFPLNCSKVKKTLRIKHPTNCSVIPVCYNDNMLKSKLIHLIKSLFTAKANVATYFVLLYSFWQFDSMFELFSNEKKKCSLAIDKKW